jgi:hypothetical protein
VRAYSRREAKCGTSSARALIDKHLALASRDLRLTQTRVPRSMMAAITAARCYFRADTGVVIGSVARGEAQPESDLDLLLLTHSTRLLSRFYARISRLRLPRPLSIITYSPEVFEDFWREGSLFVFHVLTEGRTLWDTGPLRSLSRCSFRLKRDFQEDIATQAARLDVFRDPRPFRGNYLNAYARLFPIYKNTVFFSLAQAGIPVFDKGVALDLFYCLHPSLAPLQSRLNTLQAYYREATRAPKAKSHRSRGSARGLKAYVQALDTLVAEVA